MARLARDWLGVWELRPIGIVRHCPSSSLLIGICFKFVSSRFTLFIVAMVDSAGDTDADLVTSDRQSLDIDLVPHHEVALPPSEDIKEASRTIARLSKEWPPDLSILEFISLCQIRPFVSGTDFELFKVISSNRLTLQTLVEQCIERQDFTDILRLR